jgi:hypothetical protein
MFDRAMAGWTLTVLVADHTNIRPLKILGADPVDLESALASSWGHRPQPQSVAFAADLFYGDARVRRRVLQAFGCRRTEVTLWGHGCPAELDRDVYPVQHPLSAAARLYKAQAFAAAGYPEATSVGYTERFRGGLVSYPTVAVDLTPVSQQGSVIQASTPAVLQ